MGLVAALLVFTGIWHLSEFVMDRTSKDARRLIPAGAVYLLLGVLIALGVSGWVIEGIALVTAVSGLNMVFRRRKVMDIRRWVIWAFIVIDAIIAIAIVGQWF